MTSIEKAKELVNMYKNLHGHPTEQYLDSEDAKMCALKALDEILNALSYKVSSNFEEIKYYQEVKQEVVKL